jgi:O-antigen/teichoic acid export membrane protein
MSASLRIRLLRGGVGSAAIRASYIVLQFAVGVILARLLGPEALGLYAYAIAVAQLMAISAQFGFPAFLVRQIAVYQAEAATPEIKGLLIGSMQMTLVLSGIVAVAGAAVVLVLAPGLGEGHDRAIVMGLALVPVFALASVNAGALQGMGHPVLSQVPEQLIRPILLLIGLGMVLLFQPNLSAEIALSIQLGASLLALLGGLWVLVMQAGPTIRAVTAAMHRAQWVRQSLPFLLLAASQLLNNQISFLVLGALAPQSQVGYFRVASQTSDGLSVALIAISIVIAPQIAGLHARQDLSSLQRVLVLSHRMATLIVLPAAVALAVFGADLLALVFGEVYRPAAGAMSILVLGKAACATVGFAGLALGMVGRPGIAAAIAFGTVGLSGTLALALIPTYGVEGAAIAAVAGQLVVNIASLVWIRSAFRRDFSAFARLPQAGSAELG